MKLSRLDCANDLSVLQVYAISYERPSTKSRSFTSRDNLQADQWVQESISIYEPRISGFFPFPSC